MTQLTIAGVIAGALDGVLPPKYAALAVVVSQGAYAIARGITKSGRPASTPSESDSTGAASTDIQ